MAKVPALTLTVEMYRAVERSLAKEAKAAQALYELLGPMVRQGKAEGSRVAEYEIIEAGLYDLSLELPMLAEGARRMQTHLETINAAVAVLGRALAKKKGVHDGTGSATRTRHTTRRRRAHAGARVPRPLGKRAGKAPGRRAR